MKVSQTATAVLFLLSRSWIPCKKQFACSIAIASASLQGVGAAGTEIYTETRKQYCPCALSDPAWDLQAASESAY